MLERQGGWEMWCMLETDGGGGGVLETDGGGGGVRETGGMGDVVHVRDRQGGGLLERLG